MRGGPETSLSALSVAIIPGAGAIFSPDRAFRYQLHRRFDAYELPLEDPNPKRLALFVMLMPSTADELKNDRTIGRCITFAKRWGCTGLMVGNAYAFRSTDPQALYDRGHAACIGPDNDAHLAAMAEHADITIAAWGTHCTLEREAQVLELLRRYRPVHVVNVTKEGRPGHPLYVKGETAPWIFQ